MKGDFSRDTFYRQHRFSRVLMQQGRVMLDADWNEQSAILLHYLRTLAADLIGPHGGPGNGYAISCEDDLVCDFAIGYGHYYVDGILCENLPPVACPGSDEPLSLTYNSQPDYPLLQDDEAMLEKGGVYLVYLDVWERHVTHLQAGHIREVALGGPDTATRAKIVCQVKVATDKNTSTTDSCSDLFNRLVLEMHEGDACLRARARVDATPEDPCIIPPESRYRGAENQLYRVEIHTGGMAGVAKDGATFKWSRDNGSVDYAIRMLQGSIATLDSLGADDRLALKEGDWVEIVDDVSELRFAPRPLAKVDAIDPVSGQVTLSVPDGVELPVFGPDSTTHPILKRWDQGSDAIPVQEGKWLDLEDGVQVYFEPGGTYNTGDFWGIPARTATGNVLWPTEEGAEGSNTPKPVHPHGIAHHYAPLAIISVDPNGAVICHSDCRCTFSQLCKADDVQPGPSENAPVIENVTFNPASPDTCAETFVTFVAEASGPEPLKYTWNFGDGSSVQETLTPVVTHRFDTAGTLRVALTVGNEFGRDQTTISIDVRPCVLTDVLFPLNADSLSAQQVSALEGNLRVLENRFSNDPTVRAIIAGFAMRGEANPEILTLNRAEAVQKFYQEKGIDQNRLSTRGEGVDLDTNRPDAEKRRVETRLVGFSTSDAKTAADKLSELQRVQQVGKKRAETLLASGHDTPNAVANMKVDEIAGLLQVADSVAEEIQTSALKIAAEKDEDA